MVFRHRRILNRQWKSQKTMFKMCFASEKFINLISCAYKINGSAIRLIVLKMHWKGLIALEMYWKYRFTEITQSRYTRIVRISTAKIHFSNTYLARTNVANPEVCGLLCPDAESYILTTAHEPHKLCVNILSKLKINECYDDVFYFFLYIITKLTYDGYWVPQKVFISIHENILKNLFEL